MNLIIIFILLIIFLGSIFFIVRIAWLRFLGIYPLKGKECLENVKKLLIRNEYLLALKCYRDINKNLSLKQAREDILTIKANLTS
ncbi:MAG: hypothetical protein PHH59_06940 [Methylovulum sp.]|uniref:hypothetical protein n=1 Tax=Methylovulum sp. TaxID=1916980 RepID=UPI00262939D5|nr:hypothetical protein [Methylovulum sp.]MDD2723743.1 hypothetical protein [Methylovulum sp.]MDD5125360.1 hypothetical protein [Methylovulum sp.]